MRCHNSGLVTRNGARGKVHPIPLTEVSADVTWLDASIKVVLTQTYKNEEFKPLEVQYIFPMDDRAAVCNFVAEIDGRTILGKVKKRSEARDFYEEALKAGSTSFLVEEKTPEIFVANVGNLPAGRRASITISYVTQATMDEDALRFFLPTTIAPRYVPHGDNSEATKTIGAIEYSSFSPCPLKIHAIIETHQKALVKSPTHSIELLSKNMRSDVTKLFKTELALKGMSTDMDKDFVLLLKTPHQPRLILEKGSDSTIAAMVTMVPKFNMVETKLKHEFIYMIDRSGSMMCDKMEMAKEALLSFLKDMPRDSYFNIVSFGSNFSSLWKESQKYEEDGEYAVTQHVNEMEANLGGTDMHEPLVSIFKLKQPEGYARQIIVLTDGEVSNTEEIFSLVRDNCKVSKTRVFVLGIGNDVSHHLVNGIARAGNGAALFATLKESIKGKVQYLREFFLQPSLTSVEVTWAHSQAIPKPEMEEANGAIVTHKTLEGYGLPEVKKPERDCDLNVTDPCISVKNLPSILNGACYTAYCIYNNPEIIPVEIALSADSPDGRLEKAFPVKCEEVREGDIVHTLAARSIIRELEEELKETNLNKGDRLNKENIAIQLGIKYNIGSSLTSFVAVDEKGQMQEDAFIPRIVPSMMPKGYDGWRSGITPVKRTAHEKRIEPMYRTPRYTPRNGTYQAWTWLNTLTAPSGGSPLPHMTLEQIHERAARAGGVSGGARLPMFEMKCSRSKSKKPQVTTDLAEDEEKGKEDAT
ncbi:unnamed protein product [Darwinula stevensoni]|uniref:Uncharacterized protein n=1 Tax=Darwinula stevensoni TaxID=69355 RepID=A0A7R8XE23_9CRUS|nr:unnamed protein product [Darwinula stevensoni]CAG0895342.1 unnamed protein product [Darwinula stevensoni]